MIEISISLSTTTHSITHHSALCSRAPRKHFGNVTPNLKVEGVVIRLTSVPIQGRWVGFFDSSQQSLVVDSLHIVAALLLAVGVAPGFRGGACVNSGVWRPRDWSPIIAPHAARSLDCLRVVIS